MVGMAAGYSGTLVGARVGRVLLQPPDPPDDQGAHRLGDPPLDFPGLNPPVVGSSSSVWPSNRTDVSVVWTEDVVQRGRRQGPKTTPYNTTVPHSDSLPPLPCGCARSLPSSPPLFELAPNFPAIFYLTVIDAWKQLACRRRVTTSGGFALGSQATVCVLRSGLCTH